MDNATFHKRGRIVGLIKRSRCEVLYLPSYLPDLNPIEHHWAAIKHRIRQQQLPLCNNDLYLAAENTFRTVST